MIPPQYENPTSEMSAACGILVQYPATDGRIGDYRS